MMDDAPRPVADIEAEIKATKEQVEELRNLKRQREAELASIQFSLDKLAVGRYCKLVGLEEELKRSRQWQANSLLPPVVWIKPRNGYQWVVSKITAKRIYIRTLDWDQDCIYNKDTGKTNYPWDGQINVEATIRNFEEYQRKSK